MDQPSPGAERKESELILYANVLLACDKLDERLAKEVPVSLDYFYRINNPLQVDDLSEIMAQVFPGKTLESAVMHITSTTNCDFQEHDVEVQLEYMEGTAYISLGRDTDEYPLSYVDNKTEMISEGTLSRSQAAQIIGKITRPFIDSDDDTTFSPTIDARVNDIKGTLEQDSALIEELITYTYDINGTIVTIQKDNGKLTSVDVVHTRQDGTVITIIVTIEDFFKTGIEFEKTEDDTGPKHVIIEEKSLKEILAELAALIGSDPTDEIIDLLPHEEVVEQLDSRPQTHPDVQPTDILPKIIEEEL